MTHSGHQAENVRAVDLRRAANSSLIRKESIAKAPDEPNIAEAPPKRDPAGNLARLGPGKPNNRPVRGAASGLLDERPWRGDGGNRPCWVSALGIAGLDRQWSPWVELTRSLLVSRTAAHGAPPTCCATSIASAYWGQTGRAARVPA